MEKDFGGERLEIEFRLAWLIDQSLPDSVFDPARLIRGDELEQTSLNVHELAGRNADDIKGTESNGRMTMAKMATSIWSIPLLHFDCK